MVKPNKRFGTALVATAFMAALAGAPAFAATGSVGVITTVLAPLNIDCSATALNFGEVEPGAVDGTVTVDPSGSVSSANVNFQAGGSNGACSITGQASHQITVTHDSATTVTDGVHNLDVVSLLSSVDPSGITNLDGAGNSLVTFGGTLNVPTGAVAGNYTGTFGVTAVYS